METVRNVPVRNGCKRIKIRKINCIPWPTINKPLPEDPAFSTGRRPIFKFKFSFVLDHLIAEAKTNFKTPTSPILNPV